ncbi:hypothetical protein KA107_01825 [Candidatus Pacearchaeota archaeon]|nr:hypothetical protein [Candidatus Pacearchaeota archaeon]
MAGYTWHKVTEEEKEEIKKNAKKLLDEFSSKLEKIKTVELKKDSGKLREEGTGLEANKEFQEFMMDNAPLVDDGLIIAERGGWKK